VAAGGEQREVAPGPGRGGASVPTTIEELEARVRALEEQVASLAKKVEQAPAAGHAELKSWLPPHLVADQAALSAAVDRAFKKMGITGTPIGAENVQAMIAACGIKPEDNEFSRGIIEMREE
jgi:hypothetical protein